MINFQEIGKQPRKETDDRTLESSYIIDQLSMERQEPSVTSSQFGSYAKCVIKLRQNYQNNAKFQIEAMLSEKVGRAGAVW